MDIGELKKKANKIRLEMIDIVHKTGRGHLSSGLSSVEIFLSLYQGGIMNYDPSKPDWSERDRFVLSKGHSGLAYFLVLKDLGLITQEEMDDFAGIESEFCTHPICNLKKGIEMSSGSLGHGLIFAIGQAYAAKLSNKNYKVYVMVGDGELQEGSNWEALLLANALHLDNLVVIVDDNGMQIDGLTESIVPLGDLAGKFKAFGFTVVKVDGHNFVELMNSIPMEIKSPFAIIASTIKGKGISFIENRNGWHGRGLLDEEWQKAKLELMEERAIW